MTASRSMECGLAPCWTLRVSCEWRFSRGFKREFDHVERVDYEVRAYLSHLATKNRITIRFLDFFWWSTKTYDNKWLLVVLNIHKTFWNYDWKYLKGCRIKPDNFLISKYSLFFALFDQNIFVKILILSPTLRVGRISAWMICRHCQRLWFVWSRVQQGVR